MLWNDWMSFFNDRKFKENILFWKCWKFMLKKWYFNNWKKNQFFFRKNCKESFTKKIIIFIVKSCTVDASIMLQKWLIQQSIRNTVRKRIITQNAAFTLWNVFNFVKLHENIIIKLSTWIEFFYLENVILSTFSKHWMRRF